MNLFTILGVFVTGTLLVVHGRPSLPGPPTNFNNLRFYYFSNATNYTEIRLNDTESLQKSNLKPETKTYILLDGFTSNLTSPMNTETKNAFASVPNANLILVDWAYYNGNQYKIEGLFDVVFAYVNALFNIPTAAENLAHFLNFIKLEKDIELSQITILSHSLGCHAAGATGRAVKKLYNASVGRIVGLDPALQFTEFDAQVRLQTGDASVVEIYHTNREMVGDAYPATGDVTIYPNGGRNQPCEEEGTPGTVSCSSHSYSWKLYNYALTNTTIKACPCRGAACHCTNCSFECGDDAISVGPSIPEDARGSYYVKTGYLQWG